MSSKVLVSASVLSADFSDISGACHRLEEAGADWVHFDVMDGVFVPNITFGMKMVADMRKVTKLFFDAHLMIVQPEKYAAAFVKAGADLVTFHLEATDNPEKVINLIRDGGAKVGISIKPGTPVSEVLPYVDKVDMVLVMTVEPGFGGQKLIASTLDKIAELRKSFPNLLIQADGGVNSATAKDVIFSGADVLVAGNAIFSSDNFAQAVATLKNPA